MKLPEKLICTSLCIGIACLAILVARSLLRSAPGRDHISLAKSTLRVLPGEFEQQEALLLSWPNDPATFVGIVAATWDRLPVFVLVSEPRERKLALRLLIKAGLPPAAVRFAQLPLDTLWARDYGPIFVRGANGRNFLVDTDYKHEGSANDDAVPSALASLFRMPIVHAPLSIEGGNLISNGEGICITSSRVVHQNASRGYDAREVSKILEEYFGCRQTVFLMPLVGDRTGHVDTFATFTAPDTIVIGRYPPDVDLVNSAILDHNAVLLSQVETSRGPLRVVRIPMPANHDGVIRTYTNTIYANGTLLVPTYPGVDPEGEAEALATFRSLLPDWKVMGIDCSGMIKFGGAIHCISLHLTEINHLPDFDELKHQIPKGGG